MTMPDQDIAIQFANVTKTYRLYQSKWQQVMALSGFRKDCHYDEFSALKDVDFTVKRGERLAIVGRNGAGKTTLLKLITRNFTPTSGQVVINGSVQALMDMGLGFHPEFTGLENIKASLNYNGLSAKAYKKAIEEIIDFVELGEFIDQPLRAYSLGMKARLYFAVATAIKPEILIIDEVLGAGDAYFSAKSADRMKKLTNSGCTLLLVSHSMEQCMQFCENAIWLENGALVMEDSTLAVANAYQEYTRKLEKELVESQLGTEQQPITQSKWLRDKLLKETLRGLVPIENESADDDETETETENETETGVEMETAVRESDQKISANFSRWPSHEQGLKIVNVRLLNAEGEEQKLFNTGDEVNFEFELVAEESGEYDCSYVLLIITEDARTITRQCSSPETFYLEKGQKRKATLTFDKLCLGNGRYIFSSAIYKILELKDLSTARFYDLLARSFEFTVMAPYHDDASLIYHPSEWKMQNTTQTVKQTEIAE